MSTISTQVLRSSIKKSKKSDHANFEDRIRDLPESLISDILSCLPAKDAVRTCVLSKYWEPMWTSIYNIDIDDTGVVNQKMFPNYVERILLSQNVRSFRLHYQQDYPLNRMAEWISALLRQNVESFEVLYRSEKGLLLLPGSLLDNTSLRILKLELLCTFKVPSNNCFPYLSSLYLDQVEIRNELYNSDTLIFVYPVLETLNLIDCKWLNVKFVEIHAPKLKKLATQTPYNPHVYGYSIKILADRLVHFESWGCVPENLILSVSSVVCATFGHTHKSWDPRFDHGLQVIRSLFEGLQSLEYLKLFGWPLSTQEFPLRSYDKLQRLTLCRTCINIKSLLKLLHATPSLKAVVVTMFYYCVWPDYYDYEGEESLSSCIVNKLEEVKLIYVNVLVSEYRLEKFLLKNGLGLKTFHLRGGYHEKEEIVKFLKVQLV